LSFSILNYTQAALGFLITIFLARTLSKTDFGYYTFGMIFFNSFFVLTSFGLDKSQVRDIIQLAEDKWRFHVNATWLKVLVGGILISATALWVLFFGYAESIKNTVLLLGSISGVIFALSAKAWYDAIGGLHRHAIITLCERIIFFLSVILIINLVLGSTILIYIFSTLLLLKGIVTSYEWASIKDRSIHYFVKAKSSFKKIISSNVWLWLAAIGNLIMVQCNQLILENNDGLSALAAFGLAFQIVHFIKILQGQILRLATPQIAKVTIDQHTSEIMRNLIRLCGLSLLLTLMIVIPFYFFIPIFIETVIGVNFSDSIPVFNVLLLWVSIYGIAIINNQFLVSLKLERFYFGITILFGIGSLFLSFLFIEYYGAIGAAYSLLVSHGCSIIAQFAAVLYTLKIR